jgi:hypothetical protein
MGQEGLSMRLRRSARLPWPSALLAAGLVLGAALPASAQLLVDPPQAHFSAVPVGVSGPTVPFLVRNLSFRLVRIFGVGLIGPHVADFQMTPTTCPAILGPGQGCVLQVTFTPTQQGTRQALLFVDSDDILQPRRVAPLEGFGTPSPTAPMLSFIPTSLAFASQPVGSPVTQRPVALNNTGQSDLHVSQIAVVGANPSDFQRTTGCDQATIAPGAICWIIVSFSPGGGGPRSAALVVVSDTTGAPGSQSVVPMSGRGARPELTPSPASVEFGGRPVGVRGADLTLRLRNTGDDMLVISGLSVSGGQPGDFVIPAGYSCSAAPGQECPVTIGFVPTSGTTRATELVVASNVAGPAVRVLLRGLGQFPTVPAPPAPLDDHRFLSSGAGLVPSCGTSTTPPPNLVIPVTRVVGPVPGPGGGRLLAPAPLIAAGVLGATATLQVAAYNVQTPPGQSPPRVIVNGVSVGFLAGSPGAWSVTTLSVPIRDVLFPSRSTSPPTPPTAANNVVSIAVGAGGPAVCTAPAWARLSFTALSPVVLVHGNGSNGAFFVRQGLAGFLDGIGIPNDRSINLPTTSIAANAATLQTRLPAIAASFGVNSIHVIAHSKGGLDMRSWMGTFGTSNGFRVLSLTTLSTPHAGSPLADASLAVNATGIGVPGLPLASLSFLGLGGPAMSNLTTSFTAGFNPPLPAGADYRSVGADADRRLDGLILSSPVDEYAAARVETPALASIFASSPAAADALVTAVYHFMRNTAMVRVTLVFIPIPFPPFFIPVTVPLPIPNLVPAPNDLLVSLRSALGAPSPFVPALAFTGTGGRDHADIANGGVGAAVLPLLISTDLTRGDLI